MIAHLFKKEQIPKELPFELIKEISLLSQERNKEKVLQKCFYYTTDKWKGYKIGFFLKIHYLFLKDPFFIIKWRGYMHCTIMNYILRIMLVKSWFFKDNDIEIKLTNVIHQYLIIKISDWKTITLDPWGYQFWIEYGEYANGFNLFSVRKNSEVN